MQSKHTSWGPQTNLDGIYTARVEALIIHSVQSFLNFVVYSFSTKINGLQ